jgi:hypothetical protein
MVKSYDSKSFELAEHFLHDERGAANYKDRCHWLALEIQQAVEDFCSQCDCGTECRGPDTTSALCRAENEAVKPQ